MLTGGTLVARTCWEGKNCWVDHVNSTSSKVVLGVEWAASLTLLVVSIILRNQSGAMLSFTRCGFAVSIINTALATILMVPSCRKLRVPAAKPEKVESKAPSDSPEKSSGPPPETPLLDPSLEK